MSNPNWLKWKGIYDSLIVLAMISSNNSKNCATKRDARSGFENGNLNAYKTTLEKMDYNTVWLRIHRTLRIVMRTLINMGKKMNDPDNTLLGNSDCQDVVTDNEWVWSMRHQTHRKPRSFFCTMYNKNCTCKFWEHIAWIREYTKRECKRNFYRWLSFLKQFLTTFNPFFNFLNPITILTWEQIK